MLKKKISFQTAYENFLLVEGNKWSSHEYKTKISRFKNWILPRFGTKNIESLTYSDFQEYINELDDKNIKGEIKCARKTQEHIKSSIQAMYTYLTKEGVYTKINPAKYVEIKPYDNHVHMTLTVEQISKFYQNIINIDTTDLENRKKRLILLLMIHGRRLSEARNLEKCELRFLTNDYTIPAHKSKDGKTHVHEMTKFLRYEFFELIYRLKDTDKYLFINPSTGRPYKSISKFFDSVKKQSGIPKSFRCQDFRHVIGTLGRNELNMALEDLRDVLGHGSVTTTEIYSEKNKLNSKKVNNKLFGLLGLVLPDEI